MANPKVANDNNVSQTSPSNRVNWFFGIGIDDYVEFPKLNNAVKDVKDVLNLLIANYGFSQNQATTIFNENANRENLIDQFDRLVEKVGEDDNLLIYFSGHGHLNKNTKMGYWIPHDAKKGSTARYIRNSTIRDYLKDIQAKHTLLISDSCFSGSLFVRDARRSSVAMDNLESFVSRWAICSGRHDELVCDGEPGGNSPFAKSILDVLRQNKSEKLNVMKVVDRVIEKIGSNNEQQPEGKPVYGAGDDGGQFIFHLKAREDKFWEDCQRKDNIRDYSQYLRQFPTGKYKSEAKNRIKELEDESAWRKAEKSGKISALYDYIDQYEFGQHVKEALEKIKILEKREEDIPKWINAKTHTKKIFDPLIPISIFLKSRPILRTIFGVWGMIIYMISMIWFVFWNVPIYPWMNTKGLGFLIFITGTLFLYLWYSSWDKKNENHAIVNVLKALFLSWLVISTIIFIISAIFSIPNFTWLHDIWLPNLFAAISSFIWFRAFSRLK